MTDLKKMTVAASGKLRQVAYDILNEQTRLLSWQHWGRSIIIDRRFTTISPRSEGGRMEFVERTLRLSLLF